MRFLLLIAVLLSGCAVNDGLDHRITCSMDGKASFVVTYGPIAFTQPARDADLICSKLKG